MDGTEGSSSAAQRAQSNETILSSAQGLGENSDAESADSNAGDGNSGGFFRRIIGALSPTDAEKANLDDLNGPQPNTLGPQAHGMINLRTMRVEDVMVPKADINAISATASREELLELFRSSGMTRLPVYEGTLDTPIGMAHLKDFALRYGFNGDGVDFDFKEMLRPLVFVPPSMTLGVLLTKMQAERRHMALVIDEYGGVDGLVTIEDLIEQVIGDIADEHDVDEGQFWTLEKPGQYLALSKTPLEDFEAEIGINLTEADEVDEEEIDTLGGLVFMLTGRVPARGEVVAHPAGPEFEIVDADPRRIKRLRVRLPGVGNAV